MYGFTVHRLTVRLNQHNWCPMKESDLHLTGFEPVASASWANRALLVPVEGFEPTLYSF
jgi:hypothetical protein